MNKRQQNKAKLITGFVFDEYMHARTKFPAFNNFHEGYAVLLEELDELWDEIKKNSSIRDLEKIIDETIHVGAMATAILVDLIPDKFFPKSVDGTLAIYNNIGDGIQLYHCDHCNSYYLHPHNLSEI